MSRIVLIEDHAEIARLIEAILVSRKHQVKAYPNGQSGLDAMRRAPPDLLVLDVGLPDMNGFEVAMTMRSDMTLSDVPILMLTALNDIDNRLRGLEVADDYLTKPFEKRELLARAEALLRRNTRSGGLRGRLELMGGAAAAVQIVALAHPKGAFILDDGAIVYFDANRVVHAVHPQLSGRDAVTDAFSRQQGGFRFEPYADPPERSLNLDPMALLLDTARLSDEASRRSQTTPQAAPRPPTRPSERPPKAAQAAPQKAAPQKAAPEAINIDAKGLTVVPNLSVARTYIDMLRGMQKFTVRERWDKKHNDTCVVFEGDVLMLVALHSSLSDISEDFTQILEGI
ncbi:MAG: response regulator [Trueperaceae bacterium]|nr:response regulator [Trueperaceae bacterium]